MVDTKTDNPLLRSVGLSKDTKILPEARATLAQGTGPLSRAKGVYDRSI